MTQGKKKADFAKRGNASQVPLWGAEIWSTHLKAIKYRHLTSFTQKRLSKTLSCMGNKAASHVDKHHTKERKQRSEKNGHFLW